MSNLPNQPEQTIPSIPRGSIAIAEGILSAGYGPEKIADVVKGFRCADELTEEITTVITAIQAARARRGHRPRVWYLQPVASL